jgi:hypothetical protein
MGFSFKGGAVSRTRMIPLLTIALCAALLVDHRWLSN